MIRSLFTYLVLLLFLFPTIEKGLHALEHEEEEHCAAYEETHLHEKHHDCQLCDFDLEPTSENTLIALPLPGCKILASSFRLPSFEPNSAHPYFSLRAPPVLS